MLTCVHAALMNQLSVVTLIAIALASECSAPAAPSPAQPQPPDTVSISSTSPSPQHTNRLAREKSPYLLQHQHNPVDWYAWGEEAFARARAEHKPIFLSIGYSTCHWCHVMERETFEKENVALFLNQHFISIKVDREERPDVDSIYMAYVQNTSGQGGWPLTVFLGTDLKPFYGGTYFPPEGRYGRPGFLELVRQIHQLWETRHGDLTGSATNVLQHLAEATTLEPSRDALLAPALVRSAGKEFKSEYDSHHGGFGGAPKFPRPSQPALLLQYGVRFHDHDAVEMVLHTCEHMAAGGIYDQLGGGFARYSTDAQWLVPHFEKMLYDNAQLINLYLDAYLLSGEASHAAVVRDIIRYVLRDMTHPAGGFYSAEDADSEGKEGKFYCWTRSEMAELLTPGEFKVAAHYFGVSEHGNFVDHSDPHPLPNQNVLSIANPKLAHGDEQLLASAKAKLFAVRSKRVRPHLDDKVLASWNGLMLGAVARAYAVLGDESYLAAAEKNFAFIRANLWDASSKTLYHRWRDGEHDSVQLLDAYAFLLSGVLELYQTTLNPDHLQFALDLAEAMMAKFYDKDLGGFWESPAGASDLILRLKDDYDGAEPSGNSTATLALLKLSAITDRADLKQASEKTLRLFAQRMQQAPQVMPNMLLALDFFLHEPRRVVLSGTDDRSALAALLRATHAVYQPNKVILGATGPVEPFAKTLPPKDNHPTAYVCTGTSCQPPTQDPEKVRTLLRE